MSGFSKDKIEAALESSGGVCPVCGKSGQSAETLMANPPVRAKVRAFLDGRRDVAVPSATAKPPPAAEAPSEAAAAKQTRTWAGAKTTRTAAG